jgi:hypothetical protein
MESLLNRFLNGFGKEHIENPRRTEFATGFANSLIEARPPIRLTSRVILAVINFVTGLPEPRCFGESLAAGRRIAFHAGRKYFQSGFQFASYHSGCRHGACPELAEGNRYFLYWPDRRADSPE